MAQGPGAEDGIWTYLGGDAWHTRYTDSDQITAANFEILDGKKKQKITGFELIELKKIETFDPLERPIPIAARRHFLMFFDLGWSQPESVVKARRAARDLIDNLHPTDLAGVATYTSTQGAIVAFTRGLSNQYV